MFTGLIEEVGRVRDIAKASQSIQVTIAASKVLDDVKVGDSIATNGVCLTVVRFDKGVFVADVMPQTMRVSALKNLKVGDGVNLERALRLGDRFGGHMVSGHVDSVGIIESFRKDDNATWMTIKTEQAFMKYLLNKGSIAIDGVSLTVARLGESNFQVSIIPMTKDETTLLTKKPGDSVNLEGDLIGKYVERLMTFTETSPQEDQELVHRRQCVSAEAQYKASLNKLRDNGFL